MSRAIDCHEAVRRLWRFLDGDLGTAAAGEVEAHLDRCVTCCGELEFSRELHRLLAAQRVAALPGDVRLRLEGFLHDLPDRPDRHDTRELATSEQDTDEEDAGP